MSKHSLFIAVKKLLDNASSVERVKLLQEAAIMGQFSHPNVIKLYGLVTVAEPVSGSMQGFIWGWGAGEAFPQTDPTSPQDVL